MRNLLNFLIRFNNLIIFLVLEGFAFYFLVTRNQYHNSVAVNAIRSITYGVDSRISATRSYLNLRQTNETLAAENSALRNSIARLIPRENPVTVAVNDTVFRQQYTHTSAEVISNSVNRQKNFFTINKGRLQGINKDMAVTCTDGVAGIIIGCSDNFSVAMSLLNLDFRLSVRIKSNGYFGSLSWDGRDYRHASLGEIPQHITIAAGDTVETTGFSAIFPEGLAVGTISDFEKRGGDFYRISVELTTDFKKLRFVDVIGNLEKEERNDLEKKFK
jgi:rod shape-determining protein MreC